MSTQLIEFDPTPSAVAVQAQQYLAIAKAFVIDDADTYEAAVEELGTIKQIEKALDEERKARGEPARQAVNAINDAYRAPLNFCADAKVAFEDKIKAYREDQRRKAEQERIRQEAIAKAEAARLAKEAADREAAARAEAAQLAKQAADEAAKGNAAAAAAIEQQAEQAAAVGQAEAQAIATQAAMTVTVSAPIAEFIPKVRGMSGRVVWKGRIVDKAAALQAIAANPAYHHLVEFIEGEVNHIVDRQREAFNIPGIDTYQTEVLTNRRRA
jgi:hypothetical protein